MESVKIIGKKTGRTLVLPVLTVEEMDAFMMDGTEGWCLSCGAEASGVEPDARKYKCESCGERTVYGMEELFMMGAYRQKKEEE